MALVEFREIWLGGSDCVGQVKINGVWPINLSNTAGRPATVSAGITNSGGMYTAELFATNDPRLEDAGPYEPYDQCVYHLVQPRTDGSKDFMWFRVANPVQSSNEAEAIEALQSERYERALKILKTLRN
ncbi:MAG: hypothetical protein Q4P06_05240 [Actinomycetaceae bacterium]|nr:hypothetical protein [Actinomycetaceae bacterium]